MVKKINYAIIAAGEGSRLAEEGVKQPKPLVEINGEPLIKRLISIFEKAEPLSINIIVNEEQKNTLEYLKNLQISVPLNIIVKSTPSSMHSFYELSTLLKGESCCLTTVDTIFNPETFNKYIEHFLFNESTDALMAVTDFIDDEKPLYVKCDNEMRVSGFLDENEDCKYVSGGIYCFRQNVFPILEQSINAGKSKMRNFQRSLLENNLEVEAFSFGKILDIDHASDIPKAEEFLKSL